MSVQSVIVDDRDGRIQYSPATSWRPGGASGEFKGTTYATVAPGATFTFTFLGTSISVYGTVAVHPPAANTTYALDGADPVRFSAIPNGDLQRIHLFYQSPPLLYTEHTLVVTCVDQLIDHNNEFLLDFLVYTTTFSSSIAVPSLTTHSPLPTVTSDSCGVVEECRHETPVGAIAGGVVGVFAVAAIALGIFLWFKYYSSSKPPPGITPSTPSNSPVATPYAFSPTSSHVVNRMKASTLSRTGTAVSASSPRVPPLGGTERRLIRPSGVPSGRAEMNGGTPSQPPPYEQHTTGYTLSCALAIPQGNPGREPL